MTQWFPVKSGRDAFRPIPGGGQSKVSRALSRLGIVYYIPEQHIERVHPKTKKLILRSMPLLPGWLFIADPHLVGWDMIERLPEISGPIRGLDNRPIAIATAEIIKLQDSEAAIEAEFAERRRNRELNRKRVGQLFPQGSKATIKPGHWASGNEIFVKAATGRKTVLAVMQMLNASVDVEIPIELLEAAE